MDIVNCTPLVLQDVQAYPAAEVNVRVVDRCLEDHRRRAVRIVAREIEAEFEVEVCVGSIFWSDDGGSPMQHIPIGIGKGRDTGSRRHHECEKFRLEAVVHMSLGPHFKVNVRAYRFVTL